MRKMRAGLIVLAVAAVVAGCGAEPFEPDGPEAVSARQLAWSNVDRALGDVRGDADPIASGRYDGCRDGQNNWKIQDQYEHECFVVGSELLPAADSDDQVAGALQEMSGRLDELGCTTTGPTLAQVDQQYWQSHRDQADYGPGSLPDSRYDCSGVRVVIKPSDPSTLGEDLPPSTVIFLDEMLNEEPYPEDAVASAEATEAAMLWVITADSSYYANEF